MQGTVTIPLSEFESLLKYKEDIEKVKSEAVVYTELNVFGGVKTETYYSKDDIVKQLINAKKDIKAVAHKWHNAYDQLKIAQNYNYELRRVIIEKNNKLQRQKKTIKDGVLAAGIAYVAWFVTAVAFVYYYIN